MLIYAGADPGFQVRGDALKKIAPSGGRRENFWVKSWFFTRNTQTNFAPPSAIGRNMIFWRKIVIFHTKYYEKRSWKFFSRDASITLFFLMCSSRAYFISETCPRQDWIIGTNMIFWRKIVIFHTKYPKNFRASLRSAQFFYFPLPPLTWNPGSDML
jgi:hypothetical protein